MLTPTDLRTEYLTDPIGIDLRTPRLFWTCEGGISQTAYQILAQRGGETVWDTGKTPGAGMAGIAWDGPQLGSRELVEWSVRLWDEADRPGPWSTATFELGLLDSAEWLADWITGNYRPRRNRRYPVDCFRKGFTSAATPAVARLYITACGLYQASINGHRVGDFVIAPGFTSYDKRLHYQTYDVTDLIHQGENTLEIQLADGWFRGSIGAMGARNVYGRETKLLAQLEITTPDGVRRTIGTNKSWQWSDDGPIRFADMKDGEIVQLGRRPSYRGSARETSHPVVPSASNNVPVRERERFTPSITRTPSGKQLLDFGQNIAGYIELDIAARAADRLLIRFAEHLDDNGELDPSSAQVRAGKPTASPKQEVLLLCTDGVNHYKTSFAVFGFRYAEVDSDLALDPADVTAIAVYSDMAQTARFECSNHLVNRFVENTLWSMKSNFLDVPTDCPTRERAPWTGDLQIFTRTGSFLMDTSALLRKWLADLRDRQRADGRVPCLAPDVRNNEYIPGIDFIKRMDGAAGWADAAVLVPLRLYELYRDKEILRESYESMKAHVLFQIGRTDRTGLFAKPFPKPDRKYISNAGQAFGEWLEPKDVYAQKVPWDFIAPHPEVATAYLAYACGLMVEVAKLLGHDEDIPLYAEYHRGCTRAYVNQFTPIDTDRQSKLVRPLALGLLDGVEAEQAFTRLIASIERRDYRVGTGFLSTPLILPLLSRGGRTDIAYRMLENEQAPGWLHEVLMGATSVWEDWEGEASRNHYAPGSVCQWLFETVCGIDVSGENAFTIAPQPGGTMTYASFSYDSVFGTVASSWVRDGGTVKYRFTVPANTTARIRLPGGQVEDVHAGVWEYEENAFVRSE
ncbi:family 78 glycoside hydrolase catalytic domain [Nocardia rhamnosiphila]|uniref:alpha-L-rhamnosidase n=1 Tax=Nocardia rhamnosiphila TaxID=426716 RepID=A0ABV2WRI7_9NOCA